jgi:two-component system response regulator FixJ
MTVQTSFWGASSSTNEVSYRPRVYVVDDEPTVLRSVQSLLESQGYSVVGFQSAEAFLASVSSDAVGCVITDLKMPGMNGHRLQQHLLTTHPALTVIVISGAADVATAVKVMESGAITLLEKPFVPQALIAAVQKAVEQSEHKHQEFLAVAPVRARLATLTDDERQVMKLMVQGFPNKRIVMDLHLSPRTVDRRRATILAKMGVTSVPELAALVSRISDW